MELFQTYFGICVKKNLVGVLERENYKFDENVFLLPISTVSSRPNGKYITGARPTGQNEALSRRASS
jgi:hypothetical protein